MSRQKRDAGREVHHCRVCGERIPVILRTDRRYCTDVCRKWAQRHPGDRRVYEGRGRVRLPVRPSWGRPKTLAEALRLLDETQAYATKLEASAEALKQELTKQAADRVALQDELNRERAKAGHEHNAVTSAQQRAETAERRVAELEKEDSLWNVVASG